MNSATQSSTKSNVTVGLPVGSKDLLIPELSEKYTPISVLGRGAQGTVFLAQSNQTGQKVAIKQLVIDSVSAWKTYDLFHREVDTLSKLDIPGIARFYEAAEHLSGDHPGACIVQEYIEGRTLAEMMKSGHCFSLSRIFDLALQIINILELLHHHNPPIIHRDIKPSNLILTPSQNGYKVTLIDFGAVANPQIQSGGSTVAGTFGFMPPEQISGKPGPESDIYALGVLLVSLISGVSPDEMQIKDFRLIIDPILENVPPQVVPVLRQMTDPMLQTRLTDYDKLKNIFTAFSHDKYDIPSLLPIARMPEDEFESKLLNVKYFGQTDNIELWQQLSESVPRKIPNCYADSKFLNIAENQPPNTFRQLFASKFGIVFLIISIFIIMILLCMLNDTANHLGLLLFTFRVLLMFLLLGVFTIFLFFYIRTKEFVNNRNFLINTYQDRNKKSSIPRKLYLELLQYGRRTMATVISVKQEDLSPDSFKSISPMQYIASEPPAFKIKYKFNPPDDNNPDDLIRTYTASHPLEIKPGDPLPILYLMKEDPKQPEAPDHPHPKQVIAMPFPCPLSDLSTLDRLISTNE